MCVQNAVFLFTSRVMGLLTEGRDGVVGVVARPGLDDWGIECRWEKNFSAAQTGPEAYPVSCTTVTETF